MRSVIASCVRSHVLAPSIALASLSLGSASALAVGGASRHTTLSSFQQAVRADALLEPFDGATQNLFSPLNVSAGGYVCAVSSTSGIRRDPSGVGSLFDNAPTEFNFSGRPVSAFAGIVRVLDEDANLSVGGTVNVTLNTGESFTITVAPGAGTFFGITTTQPFTSLQIDSPLHSPPISSATYEWIDDMRIGTSAIAAMLSDNCADAPTVSPITAAQYPFTTSNTGATATAIPNSCAFIPGLDNGPDVWLRFVSPVYGTVTINTCGSNMDTVLRVFDSCGASGTGADAMQIVCNDDFCAATSPATGSVASQVQFRAQAGEDYLIRVSGYAGATGSGNLSFSVVPDCAADFNHTGGPQSVQDIFDFLNAWFGGC